MDYADYTDMDRSECVHSILHCACPPWRGNAGLANALGVGSARRLRIAFRSTAFSPKSDARTRAHSKSRADCGTKHNGRKFAQAACAPRHSDFVVPSSLRIRASSLLTRTEW